MKAYRHSTNFKAALVILAMLIAVASLLYTSRLVASLRAREQFIVEVWARALEQIGGSEHVNPYLSEFSQMQEVLQRPQAGPIPADRRLAFLHAIEWAQTMPPVPDVALASEILTQGNFGIPAIITDSSRSHIQMSQNIPELDSLNTHVDTLAALARARRMARTYRPLQIVQDFDTTRLVQYVHYDESRMIRELRIFPYIQLLFVALFVLIGYLGFSYVRRSEQRSLWVGMAREAAHQLGTPISSLMGWLELLRLQDLPREQEEEALSEIERDIERLRRVAGRFSDIGSLPKLEPLPLAMPITNTAAYIRRRIPQLGKRVTLEVSVPNDIVVPMNAELFEWVIENLLKNALDAIEATEGQIGITGRTAGGQAIVEVTDTGKGIDRRNAKDIFRPGFSTKKRGWGLGLSLAKRIVEDYHGGSLTLAWTKPGQGTTFRIELPLAEAKS